MPQMLKSFLFMPRRPQKRTDGRHSPSVPISAAPCCPVTTDLTCQPLHTPFQNLLIINLYGENCLCARLITALCTLLQLLRVVGSPTKSSSLQCPDVPGS